MSAHERLVERMTTDELRRKADLSRERANLWTREQLDYVERRGKEIYAEMCGDEDSPQAKRRTQ